MQQQSGTVVPPTVSYAYPQQQQFSTQPQVIIQQPHYTGANQGCCSGRREKYPSSWAIALGSCLLTIGIICIGLSIAAISVRAAVTLSGHGIWTGIFFIITGSLTIAAGKGKYAGLVVASMVMSIIAASSMVPSLLSGSATGLSSDLDRCRYNYHLEYGVKDCDAGVGLNGAQLAMSIIVLPIAIGIAVLGCIGGCRGQRSQGQVLATQQVTMTSGTAPYPGNSFGQPMPYQPQGYVAPSVGNEKNQPPPPYTTQQEGTGEVKY